MATNFNGLRKTAEVLTAIEDKVKALTLDNGQKAFETVGLFDAVDLEAALRVMLDARNRVCVIIFDSASFDSQWTGGQLDCKQKREIDLLVSDRVIDRDPRKAIFGSSPDGRGEHPGVLALQDLVIEQVSGLLLANPKGVYLAPVGAEPIVVSDAKAKEMPGRRGAVAHFEARGGLLTKDCGKGPIQ